MRFASSRISPAASSASISPLFRNWDRAQLRDLNPHLTYATPNIALSERQRSIGDPRGVAWNAAGTRAYVTGMGSNNIVAVDAEGVRAIPVGEGPTGIVLDEARDRAYVLNKFEASISIVSLSGEAEIAARHACPSSIRRPPR